MTTCLERAMLWQLCIDIKKGKLPWIIKPKVAYTQAMSFGFYGLFRRFQKLLLVNRTSSSVFHPIASRSIKTRSPELSKPRPGRHQTSLSHKERQ
mmetsp:Transcript_24826/g.98112  ORF Transcript_24826/g.98112 Transcript_24826/m.98112 type:complete len:95 (-) Transcript_24826:674-958(-)